MRTWVIDGLCRETETDGLIPRGTGDHWPVLQRQIPWVRPIRARPMLRS